jgi:hypothetical protein
VTRYVIQMYWWLNLLRLENNVRSTARRTIQNCQISPVDFQLYTIRYKAHFWLGVFDSTNLSWCCPYHRISILAYAIEQQWWQLGVPKNEMSLISFIFKMMLVLYQSVSISGSISNIYWHACKWSSISFSHWQCPRDSEFSFPRFVGQLILRLWSVPLLFKKIIPRSLNKNKRNHFRFQTPWWK